MKLQGSAGVGIFPWKFLNLGFPPGNAVFLGAALGGAPGEAWGIFLSSLIAPGAGGDGDIPDSLFCFFSPQIPSDPGLPSTPAGPAHPANKYSIFAGLNPFPPGFLVTFPT